MTALRPEHDAGYGGAYGPDGYESDGYPDGYDGFQPGVYGDARAFEAAVDGLADPLNDPLPGQESPSPGPSPSPSPSGLRAERPEPSRPPAQRQGRHRGPRRDEPAAPGPVPPPPGPVPPSPRPGPGPEWSGDHYRQYAAEPPQAVPAPAATPISTAAAAEFVTQPMPVVEPGPAQGPGPLPPAVTEPPAPEPRTGGRAERRKAAAKGGGRGRRRAEAPEDEDGPGSGGNEAEYAATGSGGAALSRPISAPLSRVEARRAARARKESPAVIASRAIGELFISFGVLMLLFVGYQLWWTNIQAGQYAGKEADKIQSGWAAGRQPGAFEPGQGFAIMHIPKLDVVVPIAEGISKPKVLDRGMVGHYAEGSLKTAMPSDKQGNFAVAGHRNTHGEPFRYINRLQPGDEIIVETQDAYYTYDMASILPQTPPSNVSVITPVPPGSGFTKPGRYITLTTCTPEFTSTYRMIVWGKMVDERPRSKGKPDALVG
ncbi:class E sortase [Streptomyces sp. NPDC087851]|uniref:class E sortase n=1 Tax=Streptomyces sp. NPDC087851 TaxID=3365810 RepID=UPI00382333C9